MKALFPSAVLALALWGSLPCLAGPRQPQPDMPIDGATRNAVVEALATSMEQHYVSPATAQQVARQLRAELGSGKYDQLTSARQLAKALSDAVRGATRDGHLRVRYSASVLQQAEAAPDAAAIEAGLAREYRHDNGIVKVERLDGNIGYISISVFGHASHMQEAYAAAMTLLNGTDALIIDLRATRGGEPDGVALLESYFFDRPTLMNTIYSRRDKRTEEFWTSAKVKGPRYDSAKPVYILTSASTFSGGEDFAYSMQVRRRATVAGAVTGGGANPGEMRRLHDHFEAFIPDGRAINPVTKTNWEGVGVTPDIIVAPDAALREARALALRHLAGKAVEPGERAALTALLQQEG